MQTAATADILIIGAGIAGASLAGRLAGQARVIILEAEDQPGFHATGRSAANYEPVFGPPLIRKLTVASGAFYNAPPDGFAAAPLLSWRDVLMLGGSEDEAAAQELIDVGYRPIDGAAAARLCPQLRKPYPHRILLDDTNRDLDVEAVLRGFLGLHRRGGGQVVCKARVERGQRRDGVWRVETNTGVYEAPLLVNAAGAWADDLARRCGVAPLGLTPKRRSACIVAGPPGVDVRGWPQLCNMADTFYAKPMGGKLMISPADADPAEPHDAFADDLRLAEAIDVYQSFVDHEVTRIESSWGGLRTFAPDGNPVIGFDGHADGFFWSAGQGGYGLQTAPAWSELAAALVMGRDVPAAIHGVSAAQLSPRRFGHARTP
jgi:D-arginine dehydrogenase